MGAGLIPSAVVEQIIRTSDSASDALEALDGAPRIAPPSIEIPARFAVLQDVMNELLRQDAKWGEQNHPDGTGPEVMPNEVTIAGTDYASELADYAKAENAKKVETGSLTWLDILIEEVWEAFAEPESSPALRDELIQVAAVAVQWVLSIDRRRDAAQTA